MFSGGACSAAPGSDFNKSLGMATNVPTRIGAEVGQQRMHAPIDLRIRRLVLDLPVLLVNGVKNIDCNLAELRTAVRNLVSKSAVVA